MRDFRLIVYSDFDISSDALHDNAYIPDSVLSKVTQVGNRQVSFFHSFGVPVPGSLWLVGVALALMNLVVPRTHR